MLGDEAPAVAGRLARAQQPRLRDLASASSAPARGRRRPDRCRTARARRARSRSAPRRAATPGRRSAAALFAACRVDARERRRRLPETLELHARERQVAVGGGEMRHHADDVARRSRKLGQPPPPHPGVELEVDRHALRDLAADTVSSRRASRAARHRRSPSGRARGSAASGSAARSVSASATVATQSAVAPAVERCRAQSTAPCPYPSALTTAQSSAPSSDAHERLRVAAQRAEVDRELAARHRPTRAGRAAARGRRARAAAPAGGRRRRRPACGSTSSAATPCATAAVAAASCGSIPFARNAATMPVSTSPEPAVASAGVPYVATSTPSRGAATSVSAPFSSTTEPNREAARAHRVEPVRVDLASVGPRAAAPARRCAA